jgi:hypothetical protein
VKDCILIQIRALDSHQSPFDLRQIGFAAQGEAKKAGASCVAWWKDGARTMALQGIPLSRVTQMVAGFGSFVASSLLNKEHFLDFPLFH